MQQGRGRTTWRKGRVRFWEKCTLSGNSQEAGPPVAHSSRMIPPTVASGGTSPVSVNMGTASGQHGRLELLEEELKPGVPLKGVSWLPGRLSKSSQQPCCWEGGEDRRHARTFSAVRRRPTWTCLAHHYQHAGQSLVLLPTVVPQSSCSE